MNDIPMLVNRRQETVALKIDKQLKERLVALKREGVDTPRLIKDVIEKEVDRVEKKLRSMSS